MSEVQQQVQQAIDQLVESGTERGVQVAVYRRGEQVVDAVAGVADPTTGRPVTSDTPFYNYSIGKGATTTVAHILAERGLFGYDTPIVELWPEFGAHGKHSVTVGHVLDHTAGVGRRRRELRLRRHRHRDGVRVDQEPTQRLHHRHQDQPARHRSTVSLARGLAPPSREA